MVVHEIMSLTNKIIYIYIYLVHVKVKYLRLLCGSIQFTKICMDVEHVSY